MPSGTTLNGGAWHHLEISGVLCGPEAPWMPPWVSWLCRGLLRGFLRRHWRLLPALGKPLGAVWV
eukprot:5412461-Pyramimonas_sp.AAC.1